IDFLPDRAGQQILLQDRRPSSGSRTRASTGPVKRTDGENPNWCRRAACAGAGRRGSRAPAGGLRGHRPAG
ncbi:hypothetical protein, partial [Streptomyces zhihengii]